MGAQGFFIRPCCTVNTLQHLVFRVTAPVSPGNAHQLEMVAETHVWHVWTTAHVGVFFVMIERWSSIFADVLIQNRDLVFFTTGGEGITGFLPAHNAFDYVVIGFRQFKHTFFEGFDIFLSQLVLKIDVVIEAVIDHRTDRHLGLWP